MATASIQSAGSSTAAGSTGTGSTGTGSAGDKGIDAATRAKISDLGSSDKAVLDMIQSKFAKEDLTPLQQNELQYLFSKRQQEASLISNLLRAAFDAASNVVRNIRG